MTIVKLPVSFRSNARKGNRSQRAVLRHKAHESEGDLPFFESIAALLALFAFFQHHSITNLGELEVASKYGLCAILAVLVYTVYRIVLFISHKRKAPSQSAPPLEGLLNHSANGWSDFQRIFALAFMIGFIISGGFENLRHLDNLGWYGLAAMTTVLWRATREIVLTCLAVPRAQRMTLLIVGVFAIMAFACCALWLASDGRLAQLEVPGATQPAGVHKAITQDDGPRPRQSAATRHD